MYDKAIPNKTAAGRDEIESRARKLPTSLRSILLSSMGNAPLGNCRT